VGGSGGDGAAETNMLLEEQVEHWEWRAERGRMWSAASPLCAESMMALAFYDLVQDHSWHDNDGTAPSAQVSMIALFCNYIVCLCK
jgi:hypothetical protein